MKYILGFLMVMNLIACNNKIPTISTCDNDGFVLSEKEKRDLRNHNKISLSIQGQKEEEEVLKSLLSKKVSALSLNLLQNPNLDTSVLKYLNFTSPMDIYWRTRGDVKTNKVFDRGLMDRINPSTFSLSYTFESHHLIDLLIQKLPTYKDLTILWLSNSNSFPFPKTHPQQKKLEKVLDLLLVEKKLKRWRLEIQDLDSIPYRIGQFKSLELLSIKEGKFNTLPESIGQLTKLKSLILSENKQLVKLPESIGNLTEIDQLYVYGNQLTKLPASIATLKKLRKLYANDNQLETIGAYIGELKELKDLRLSGNQLKTLPDEIQNLKKLIELHLSDNPISPEEQKRIKALLPDVTIYF